MAKGQSSKQIVMKILDVMRRYSDEDHRLSQKDVADILRNEYGIGIPRAAGMSLVRLRRARRNAGAKSRYSNRI